MSHLTESSRPTTFDHAAYERIVRDRADRLQALHRAHDEPYPVQFGRYSLILLPGVFNPVYGEGARLFLANEDLIQSRRALDIGTGSGALAILAAQHCDLVVAIDVERAAVECACSNVKRLGLKDRVEIRQGDVFEPLEPTESFDLILFNPPFLNGPAADPIERALYDEDYRILGRFLGGVGDVLTADGCILLCFSTAGDLGFLFTAMRLLGFVYEIKGEMQEGNFEFFLLEIKRPR